MASRLTKENYNGAAYNDVHMNTAKGTLHGLKDIHMATSKSSLYGDVRMDTAGSTFRKGGLNPFEREIADSPEVKRKATVAQLYFLDYYFQMLGYLSARKERRAAFTQDTADRGLTHSEYMKEWKSYCGRERVLLRKRRAKLRLDQFHIIAQVGQGGYGEVFLARKRESGEVCALKKMRKSTLHKMDEIRHVLVERDILTATRTPWLVRLLYAFQDTTYVYLAMEYVPGGDFRTLMNNSGVLKEEYARFYIAEMFMAVNELHKLGYIHRDLKPENFLVDGTGHVKLTDFGLATGALNPTRIESLKIKLDRAKDNTPTIRSTLERRSGFQKLLRADPRYADSIVGSPDYMAPEVLRAKAYTYSVDYWSLGCILFEFLAGFPPFTGETPEETWTNLKKWTSVLQRPHYDKEEDQIFNLSDVAWDAITRLIAHASIRYTTLPQIQRHPFFRPLSSQSPNWDHLRSIPAPFVPQLESEEDTMYYDDFTNEEDMAKYQEVIEKQKAVAGVKEVEEPSNAKRGVWVGFTFGRGGPNTRAVQGMQGVDETGSLVTIF